MAARSNRLSDMCSWVLLIYWLLKLNLAGHSSCATFSCFLAKQCWVQDAHNTAVSDLQALEADIRQQNMRVATAETRHDDATLKCLQLHEQLAELEKQAGHVSDLEEQYKTAQQNVRPT